MTNNKHYRAAERLAAQLMPLIEPVFSPAQDPQQANQVRKLMFRILFKQLSQSETETRQKSDCKMLSQKLLKDLVRSKPPTGIKPNNLSQLTQNIASVLENHPYNALMEYGFFYITQDSPSFFMSTDATGNPDACDWGSLHRNYHIQCQYPFEGYVVWDMDNALSCLGEDRHYLIEVGLPIYCQFHYLDNRLHRRYLGAEAHDFKMLIVSDYYEIRRYELNNIEDIETLKHKGLFTSPFEEKLITR